MTASNHPPILKPKVDEISIRKLLLKLIEYVKLIVRNWYLILLAVVALGGYKYHNASKLIDTYPARIKLFVNPPKIDKNNAVLVEIFSRLMNSQHLLLKVLLKPIIIEGESNSIINTYLSTYYSLNPAGLSLEIPKGFQFKNMDLSEMRRIERQVLNAVIEKINTPMADFSDGFISVSGDYKLGLLTVNVSSPSEELSILMIDAVCSEIKALLLANTGLANQSAFVNLASETDSLSNVYEQTYYELNKYKDQRGRLIASQEEGVAISEKSLNEIKYLEKKIHRLSAQAEISKTGYLATLEQQKIAQLDRDQNAIGIEELERSFAPIKPYRPDNSVAAIKGGVLGGIAMISLLIFLSIFLEVRKELSTPA